MNFVLYVHKYRLRLSDHELYYNDSFSASYCPINKSFVHVQVDYTDDDDVAGC